MSHELEVVDGKASFVYNGQTGVPWHLLGESVDGHQPASVMLKKANADYDVWTEPVYVKDERSGEFVEVENRFATVRINPHTDILQPFSVFTGRYTVLQNRDVLDKALGVVGASQGDAVIDTLGVMFNGAQFFAAIDLGTLVIDPNGVADEIGRYILVKTSHDGSSPVVYANTDIRVVCNNTCRLAEREAKATFKARHTPNAEDRLVEAQRVLSLNTEWAKSFRDQANALLAIDIPQNSARFDRVMERLMPASDATTDRQKANRDEIITKINLTFANNRNGARVGFNGWGLYNAVVEYQDWGRPRDLTALATDAMNESGLTAKKKIAAQAAILSLV